MSAGNSLISVMAAGVAPRVRAETRSAVPSFGGGGWMNIVREGFPGAWQRNVTLNGGRQVLAFSAVFACVTVIASDIAKMRIKLVKEDDDGTWAEVDKVSPFAPVLRRPNRFQNRIKFVEQWIVSKLLHGNTYVLKARDGRGIVTRMYVLDPQRVTPLVAEDGSVYYQLSADHLSGLTENVTVPASEIIHDAMVALYHPLVGVSPIFACGHSATMGNKIQANSTKFFDNMSRPSGMLVAPGTISDETAARLKLEWDANFGGGNLGRTAVLGDGLKYEPMTIPAEQAQLIEQLRWTVEDVARCFHIPLYKIGGPVPAGSSIDSLNQGYYSDCLQALVESLELCLDEGLTLPYRHYTELDLDSLLRMDQMAMMLLEKEGVGAAIKAPNESRRRLNLKPKPGGDSLMMQQQNYSLEALAKRDSSPDPFGQTQKPAAAAPTRAAANDEEIAAQAAELIAYVANPALYESLAGGASQ